jgi:hypothetical protein
MSGIELVRRRLPDGTVVLEAVPVSALQKLRRALRRLLRG